MLEIYWNYSNSNFSSSSIVLYEFPFSFRLGLRGAFIVNALICVASFIATGTIIGVNNLNALLTGDFQEYVLPDKCYSN